VPGAVTTTVPWIRGVRVGPGPVTVFDIISDQSNASPKRIVTDSLNPDYASLGESTCTLRGRQL
jgi:hypothetical protein